ncbi:MAG TPA: hypothetical protein VEU51_09140 [Candidatus Acidoferrales bacterium]|nr:hypothetical protein [Candidatus Acidoferrales bacterium]
MNCEGPSAWIIAPTPDTGVANVSVSGPLPPLAESDVHSTLSPAVKPAPAQLQTAAGHTTAIRLLGPASVIEPCSAPTDNTLALAPIEVPSAPSCDHWTESVAPCAFTLPTWTSVSAHAPDDVIRIASARLSNRFRLQRLRNAITG